MSTPVRLALIGAGIYAQDTHAPALLQLQDQFEVVAIYSRTLDKASTLAQRFPGKVAVTDEIDTILHRADIEAVDIVLPIGLMPSVIKKALAAGKHVVSEKPIAGDMATGRALLEVYARHQEQVWMVGEQWRYEDAMTQAAALLRQGVLGKLILAQWAVFNSMLPGNKYYHTAWRRDNSFAGGLIVDGGVHRTAVLRLLLGEVSQVSAFMQRTREDLPPADTFSANLLFENGVVGSFSTTYSAGVWVVQPLTIIGTKATLRVEREMLELIEVDREPQAMTVDSFQGTTRQLAAFARAIRQGTPHLNTPQEALHDLAIIEAMFQSAASGRVVAPEAVEG